MDSEINLGCLLLDSITVYHCVQASTISEKLHIDRASKHYMKHVFMSRPGLVIHIVLLQCHQEANFSKKYIYILYYSYRYCPNNMQICTPYDKKFDQDIARFKQNALNQTQRPISVKLCMNIPTRPALEIDSIQNHEHSDSTRLYV